MDTTIQISELTDGSVINGKWIGTGTLDILLNVFNDNINMQFDLGRLKGTDYAQVYLSGFQATIAQAVDFLLKQKEMQARLEQMRYELENIQPAQVDKINAERMAVDAQTSLTVYELENIKPAELLKINYENTVLLPDQHTTYLKQQTLLDTQEQAEQYKVDNILPIELSQIQKQIEVVERTTVISESELADRLLTSEKQRTLLDTQEQAEQYRVDNILPKEAAKLKVDTALPIANTLLATHVDLYSRKQLDTLTELVRTQTPVETLFNVVATDAGIGSIVTPAG